MHCQNLPSQRKIPGQSFVKSMSHIGNNVLFNRFDNIICFPSLCYVFFFFFTEKISVILFYVPYVVVLSLLKYFNSIFFFCGGGGGIHFFWTECLEDPIYPLIQNRKTKKYSDEF